MLKFGLRDFWNRPNVYEILETCILVLVGTKIMVSGCSKHGILDFGTNVMFTRFLNLGFVGWEQKVCFRTALNMHF